MDQSQKSQPQSHEIICSIEALDLLNCVTEIPYDQEKCLRLLNNLRNCVLNKNVKKFSLAEQNPPEEVSKQQMKP